ncbi:MAG: glycosyltransferase, partial [Candidatus Aenigmarchaeota archaeon]|nr:glycosyltransferase [Candidatus Aenigmarchaeota archaeon]
MELPSLTIVLPAFNEERIIAKTINSSKLAAERVTSDFEILVVNDGSRDRTGEIIKRLSLSEPWL